jgi:hypothetical protein
VATRKDKDEAPAEVTPTAVGIGGDGIGEVDEKVNPAQDELEKAVAEANAKGFYGVEVDPTPNEHYTVDGVVAGKPTPENPDGRRVRLTGGSTDG